MRFNDPDRTVLHRAIRIAIVLPILLWIGLHVLHDPQFALVAAFGSFAALAMADFMGPAKSRLFAHAVLAVVGAAFVVLGTTLSNTLWPAVIAMLVLGSAVQYLMALGGQVALGNNAAVLAYVVAVMVPAGDDAIPSRVAGWLVAIACSTGVSALLWPRHERRDLYASAAAACVAIAVVVRRAAEGGDATSEIAAAGNALARVRENQRALGFRQIGRPEHQRALLGLIDGLAQTFRFSRAAAGGPLSGADRVLAAAVAGSLDGVGAVMTACASGEAHYPQTSLDALVAARHEHRLRLDDATRAMLATGGRGEAVVGAFSEVFPIRVLSYITLAMAVDALVISGRPVRVEDDFALVEPVAPQGAWRNAIDVLRPLFTWSSVWLHNSLRAGIALALSVLVAKATDVGHAFWVVLATLAVLRSNVATTGTTVVSAVVGTLAGFVLATFAIVLIGPYPVLLWITLPIAVFLAGYAPTAISFGAGQAMFALLVVELFNLMAPDGWEVGVARVEAVVLGALVALAASLIMWPKGAGAALRSEIAAHVRSATALVQSALGMLIARADPRTVEARREDTIAARHRADEAFASFIGERGAKRIPLEEWAWLARVPLVMRGAGEAAIAMQKASFVVTDAGDAGEQFDATLQTVAQAYDELAARLDDPHRPKDASLQAAVAALDMMNAAAPRHAALLGAIAAYVEAHRDDAATVPRTMALVFGAGWLAYLAHVRVMAEPALDDVAAHADVAWWQ